MDAQTLFRKQFAQPPAQVVRAPGRLELLGNHTDYNDGLVLSLAIDKHIEFAVSPRADGKIELVSSAFPGREIFSVDQFEKNPAAPWTDYVKGVLAQLRKRGIHFKGFNAAIHGTIPQGAGMSSSAALEVATALAVRQLYPFSLTETGIAAPPKPDARGKLPALVPREERLSTAKVCQAAENEFVGVRCGLLDQISSLFGKAWHVMEIDFKFLTVELAPLPGEAIVVCDSGVKHALVGGEYNELRSNCEGAARAMGVSSLRAADMKMLEAGKAKMSRARISMRPAYCQRNPARRSRQPGVARGRPRAIRPIHVAKPRKLARFFEEQHAGTGFARGSGPQTSRVPRRATDRRRFRRRDHQSRPASPGARVHGIHGASDTRNSPA